MIVVALAIAAIIVEVYYNWTYTPDASVKSTAVFKKIIVPRVVVIVHNKMELEDATCLVSSYISLPIYTHPDG